MNKIYGKLALTNISKNKILYIPFILSGMLMTAFVYMMLFIVQNEGLNHVPGSDEIKIIMALGAIVISFFSYIFIFYTNSFLVKRRKKEFGVYNMLGLEKRHIGRVLSIETALVALISIGGGLVAGIAFSKAIVMLLLKIIGYNTSYNFYINWNNVAATAIIFAVLYIIILLYNLIQIYRTNTIELIKGGNLGEREPKTKTLLAFVGFACLFAGYYLAITTENPVTALMLFFVAVVLVIIGTYLLFTAGSIFILKLLKKNKNYYYNKHHMTSVSGMLYRMKQNAAGLSNICILSTMVLVTISTTVCLYVGTNDVVDTRFPNDICITANFEEAVLPSETAESFAENFIDQYEGVSVEGIHACGYFSGVFDLEEDKIGMNDDSYVSSTSFEGSMGSVMSRDSFLQMNPSYKGEIPVLEKGQAYLCGSKIYGYDRVSFFEQEFQVLGSDQYVNPSDAYLIDMVDSGFYLILSDDEEVARLFDIFQAAYGESNIKNYTCLYLIDVEGARDVLAKMGEALYAEINTETALEAFGNPSYIYTEVKEELRKELMGLYGGLLFLGICCGTMFLMVTVLIIFYKQISEGYDDRERFVVMEKVGMSKEEVKKTINAQVRMVFFLPLLVSFCHLAGAFPMMKKMLMLLMLTNVQLFILCMIVSCLLFATIYYLVFRVTSKTYYKIVS